MFVTYFVISVSVIYYFCIAIVFIFKYLFVSQKFFILFIFFILVNC